MDAINPIFDRSKPVDEIKEVHFQSLTWNEGDFEKENSDLLQYEIYISGVNSLGQTVSVRALGFTPYFYVLVPDSWTPVQAGLFFKYVKSKLWNDAYGLEGFYFVRRKKLYPYLAGRKFRFVRLAFNTNTAFNKCRWMFTRKNQTDKPIKISGIDNVPYYEAFETNVKHVNRFCHIREIGTTGWLRVKNFKEDLEYTSCQINVTVNWKDISNDPDTTGIAPVTLYSWDIECLPDNTEEFPDPETPGDVIKQISVVLVKYGVMTEQCFIFTSSPCSKIKHCKSCGTVADKYTQTSCGRESCRLVTAATEWVDAVVVESVDEKSLLEKFIEFIRIVDPDVLLGYNTWGFDDNYFWKRVLLHDVDISKLNRINQLQPTFIVKKLDSSAYGNNEFKYMYCQGRETFDVLVALRKEHKLDAYGLGFVGKHFLGETKLDLPYRILFEKLKGGPDEVAECAAYCIQDSKLTVKIFLVLNMLPNYVEMAKASYVPIEWLLFRGQQCKVFSLIAKRARELKYVIPVHEKVGLGEKFQGATVINPLTGMYYEPIAGLDFASLYPSIMMAYNTCYTTIIVTKDMMDHVIANGIPFHTIQWESCSEKDCKNLGCFHRKKKNSYSFVQIEDENGVEIPSGTRGLLGDILRKLGQSRKDTKKQMKGVKGIMYFILNGRQLALKVLMNSVYGFTGAEKGILPLKSISEVVTATGRDMIDKTSKMAGEKFGGLTVYGDSVKYDELISVVRRDPTRSLLHLYLGVEDVPIEEFANGLDQIWKEYRGFKIGDTTVYNKEFKDLENDMYYTRTHEGYQKIKKVIRHTTKKKMYRIKARDSNGNIHQVVVTEGHSLILQNRTTVCAESIVIGTMLYDYL